MSNDPKPNVVGQQVKVVGTIVEHLQYASKEWFVIRLEDGTQITLNKKYCWIIPK